MAVDVVHFNPSRRRPGWTGYLLPKRPLNNFGDLIGPVLVSRIIQEYGANQPRGNRRLLTVGSILRLSQPGDVVWGSGINGKSMDTGAAPRLDVRAVRGPKTRAILNDMGMNVPEIYGDPALLWSRYWPREHYLSRGSLRSVAVVPNHNDFPAFANLPETVSPIGRPHDVIGEIARSEYVCGSSLHGIVLAEALGIPARLIRSEVEPAFKYDDYYGGTGRSDYRVASSVEEALRMGGERPPEFDSEALLSAFPLDIYRP